MSLTAERLCELARESEAVLRSCGAGAPASDAVLLWDYAMYRLGDDDFWAIGLTWQDGTRTRSAKVRNGEVTDHYEIYGRTGEYFSAEIDPRTDKVLALYRNEQDGMEPKLDPATGAVLQPNQYCTFQTLPADYLRDLRAIRFVGLASVYCWANKPYGRCVEFAIGNFQPQPLA